MNAITILRAFSQRLRPLSAAVLAAGLATAGASPVPAQESKGGDERAPGEKPAAEKAADSVLAGREGALAGIEGIRWQKSFESALEAAKSSQRPLLVDFEAEWCGWCKKLDRDTYGDERVIRLVNEFFVAVKVDTDKRDDLGKKHEVSGLPTILVFSPAGAEIQRLRGFRPPEAFLKELQTTVDSSRALAELRSTAEKEPENLAAQRAYARALFAAGNGAEAAKLLESAIAKAPEDPGLLLDLGDFLAAQGKNAEARGHYEKLLALPAERGGADREKAYLPLARIAIRSQDYDRAVATIGRFIDDFPTSKDRPLAHFLRGYSHARRKDAPKALEDLQAVRKHAPESELGVRAGFIIDLLEAK
jgi:thiol:disulfide interchange protein DsbD